MPGGQSNRRAARVTVRAAVDFRRPGDHRYRIKLIDFSPHGCRIEPPIRVAAGDLVWISIPGLESLPARICWVRDSAAGVEFDRPLHAAVFSLVSERMRGV